MDVRHIANTTIKPGSNHVKVFHQSGDTNDIIDVIMHADKESAQYTTEFSKSFNGDTITMCEQIYDFVQNNVVYAEDPPGEQWIKSPAQLYSDGVGDCKSFSVFIGSVLKNLNIPFVYRFVSFKKGDVTHVYVVAQDEFGNDIYLDAVPPMSFNEEHPDIVKRIDKIPVQSSLVSRGNSYVSGIGSANPGTNGLLTILVLIGLASVVK